MALLAISPPPVFPHSPGVPTVHFDTWMTMFDNYVLALAGNIEEKRKRALLIHSIGAEAQRIFYMLPVASESYADAVKALKAYFVPKLNVVAERNKFRQRSQKTGESTAEFAAALRELVATCEFGALAEDMMRDQIVEKTCNPRIRERLLLEDTLTLGKAIAIACQIEHAVAGAKAMTTHHASAEIGMVRGSTFRGAKHRRQVNASSSASRTAAGKACYRCGSTNHRANDAKCPAKSVVCRQCNKNGHYARVCRGKTVSQKVGEVSTTATENVDTVTVLQIDDVTQCSKLMCCVSQEVSNGPTVTADLIVDTGS